MKRPETIRLSLLPPGAAGTVVSVTAREGMQQRFSALGLIEGAPVACLGESPFGDPRAYRICGAVIAIRNADAAGVLLRRAEP